jgi:hypothetical protein
MGSAMSLRDRAALHYAMIGLAAAAVVSPALSARPKDGYPLSTYPMFAENKSRETKQTQAVALGPFGERVLGPSHLGTDEVMQAKATIDRAVRAGKQALGELCTRVATRAAADASLAGLERVEVRAVTFDAVDYFRAERPAPTSSRVLTRCSPEAAR